MSTVAGKGAESPVSFPGTAIRRGQAYTDHAGKGERAAASESLLPTVPEGVRELCSRAQVTLSRRRGGHRNGPEHNVVLQPHVWPRSLCARGRKDACCLPRQECDFWKVRIQETAPCLAQPEGLEKADPWKIKESLAFGSLVRGRLEDGGARSGENGSFSAS